jgi:hypothetical protein
LNDKVREINQVVQTELKSMMDAKEQNLLMRIEGKANNNDLDKIRT